MTAHYRVRSLWLAIAILLFASTIANAQSLWMPSSTASVMRPIPNWDMALYDSDNSHLYPFLISSNATANRNIAWNFGDAARTITVSGNPTLADWFDQSVKIAASPTFAGLTLSGLTPGSVVFVGSGDVLSEDWV